LNENSNQYIRLAEIPTYEDIIGSEYIEYDLGEYLERISFGELKRSLAVGGVDEKRFYLGSLANNRLWRFDDSDVINLAVNPISYNQWAVKRGITKGIAVFVWAQTFSLTFKEKSSALEKKCVEVWKNQHTRLLPEASNRNMTLIKRLKKSH